MAKTENAGALSSVQGLLGARTRTEALASLGQKTIAYFTDLTVRITLSDAAKQYVEWVLGLEGYEDLREERLVAWCPKNLVAGDLYPGELTHTPVEEAPFEIWTRFEADPDSWHLRFQYWEEVGIELPGHGWTSEGAIHFEHYIRMEAGKDGTRIQHAVQVIQPPDSIPGYSAGCPEPILDILNERELVGSSPSEPLLIPQDFRAADDFVRNTLLNQLRTMPVLVLTARKDAAGAWQFPLNADDLAIEFAGMIQIAQIEPPERFSNDAFLKAMERSEVARELNVLDGAVRLYRPGFKANSKRDEHPLWSRFVFEQIPREVALPFVSGDLAAEVAWALMPDGFLNTISHLDRARAEERRRQEQAETLLREKEARESFRQARKDARRAERVGQAEIDALAAAEIEELRASLDRMQQLIQDAETRRQADLVLLAEFEQDNEDLTRRNRELQSVNTRLATEREELQWVAGWGRRSAELGEQNRTDLLDAVLGGSPDLEQALLFLADAYPERVVVLPSALQSAHKFTDFKYLDKAWGLVRTLVTDYWQIMAEPGGGGDARAKGVFGSAYAANEAELATKSDRGRSLRTFSYQGEEVFMPRHLRIGVKTDSRGDTWRCHFYWDGQNRKIVIGHSGEHLDFF